jgi:hypothetical protein
MIDRRWRRIAGGGLLLAAGAAVVFALPRAGDPAAVAQQPAGGGDEPAECHRATGPITIDGQADEATWKQAEVLDDFVVGWQDNRPAATATRARLLWDDEALYFYAEMADADLYADVTRHDGMCWLNDVFELFFKPADDARAYYELQVNAAGTMLDMYLPSRGAGGYGRFAGTWDFQWEAKVARRGTLNKWQDADQGWSVEGRIPWVDFARTGGRPAEGDQWRFSLCRYDYGVEFESAELSSTSPLTRPDFHRYEDYRRLRFVGD